MSETNADTYKLGEFEFRSRLITGTGKYKSFDENRQALDASPQVCQCIDCWGGFSSSALSGTGRQHGKIV